MLSSITVAIADVFRTAGLSVASVASVANPPLGGLGQGKILGEEGIGVRVLEVDQNAASVLLQGAYHWVRYQDSSSQRKDT